jgi:hypothetical protein
MEHVHLPAEGLNERVPTLEQLLPQLEDKGLVFHDAPPSWSGRSAAKNEMSSFDFAARAERRGCKPRAACSISCLTAANLAKKGVAPAIACRGGLSKPSKRQFVDQWWSVIA